VCPSTATRAASFELLVSEELMLCHPLQRLLLRTFHFDPNGPDET
jgi:hypothetical protein